MTISLAERTLNRIDRIAREIIIEVSGIADLLEAMRDYSEREHGDERSLISLIDRALDEVASLADVLDRLLDIDAMRELVYDVAKAMDLVDEAKRMYSLVLKLLAQILDQHGELIPEMYSFQAIKYLDREDRLMRLLDAVVSNYEQYYIAELSLEEEEA